MVMIDHGNGYQTLYAHMSSIVASCGRSVAKGAVIGYAGATGNATGPHLHFEVRYQGGFVNPWYVLPAPVILIQGRTIGLNSVMANPTAWMRL